MSLAPALLIPWYWRFVQRLQGVVDTRPKQYLATVALPVGFFVAVFIIYLSGKPLKQRFTPELVEIARSLVVMGVALFDAILFVVIWRQFGETVTELDNFGGRLVPGTGTAVNLYIAFIGLLGTYMLTRVTKRIIRYWSESGRISPHQRELSHHMIQIILFLAASVFIFGLFGLDPADLFLGAGVLGVVLGLAARKTLGKVLSGLVILFGRPFEAGDWITVDEREGIVTDITVFNTQVRTFNEEHLLIPNDIVTDKEVINYSKTDRLRLTTEVGIDYDDDVSKAATIAKSTMESCESVADSPSPDVVLESFGDSSVVLRLRYWINRPTIQRKLSAQNEVIESVKGAFESEDIKIPFPQRELMGREATDGLEVATAGDGAVDERIERAVRPVSEEADAGDTMIVREPVQTEYGGASKADGEDEPAEDGDAEPVEGGEDEPVEEDEDEDEHAVENAAELVGSEADVTSPHPRQDDDDVYPENWDAIRTELADHDADERRERLRNILEDIDPGERAAEEEEDDRSTFEDILDSINPWEDVDGERDGNDEREDESGDDEPDR
ncbi:mechanosensitive ion channel family protein [Halobacteriales archaeon QS_7_69_60]|nr:MAG: mechanosensitive ion channel family protein [Halobacteriales archaeon QS_7_69_60]